MALSERAERGIKAPSIMFEYNEKCMVNPYNPDSNPEGIINVGMADNSLCEDLLTERLNRPDIQRLEPWQHYYTEFIGDPRFREVLAKFVTKYFKAAEPVNPAHIVTAAGVGPAVEHVAFACADKGDCFLFPAPCYSILRTDIAYRMGVRVFPIPISTSSHSGPANTNPFQISSELLENTYRKALEQGEKVKGVLLPNPLNPTGTMFNRESMQNVLQFIDRYNLHLVADEIYGLTVFGEDATFDSILTFPNAMESKRVHFVWGLSKDFALSGLRVGMIYTQNETMLRALVHPCSLSAVSSLAQGLVIKLLADNDWLDNVYLPNNLRRVREAFTEARVSLDDMGGVTLDSQAGFFNWANFNKYVSTWEEEWDLFQAFFAAGVYVAPGSMLNSLEPGWFRFTCTINPKMTKTALDRMRNVLEAFLAKKKERC